MRTPCLVIKTLDIPQMLPFINSKGSYSELFTFLVPKFGAVVQKLLDTVDGIWFLSCYSIAVFKNLCQYCNYWKEFATMAL